MVLAEDWHKCSKLHDGDSLRCFVNSTKKITINPCDIIRTISSGIDLVKPNNVTHMKRKIISQTHRSSNQLDCGLTFFFCCVPESLIRSISMHACYL